MRPSLIIAYPKQKINVVASQILFDYIRDPKMVIRISFSDRPPAEKGGPYSDETPILNGIPIWFYTCHGRQQAS